MGKAEESESHFPPGPPAGRFGSWLIINEVRNSTTGRPFSGGDVVMVFFSIIMASFQIGQARYTPPPLPPIKARCDPSAAWIVVRDACGKQRTITPSPSRERKTEYGNTLSLLKTHHTLVGANPRLTPYPLPLPPALPPLSLPPSRLHPPFLPLPLPLFLPPRPSLPLSLATSRLPSSLLPPSVPTYLPTSLALESDKRTRACQLPSTWEAPPPLTSLSLSLSLSLSRARARSLFLPLSPPGLPLTSFLSLSLSLSQLHYLLFRERSERENPCVCV